MARNEYSRRTKKDIFWGDDDNKEIPDEGNQLDFDKPSEADLVPEPTPEPPKYEPVQKPTPPKYEPPKPSQSADGILGDLNIDKFGRRKRLHPPRHPRNGQEGEDSAGVGGILTPTCA